MTVVEDAPAKANLILHVGPPRADGLHPLCSLFACLEVSDTVTVAEADADVVRCPGVEGPNLAARALELLRELAPAGLPDGIAVDIDKRIPVAAGLAGGSADAAAVLRAAGRLAKRPPATADLLAVARRLGSDVPSQLEPRHAIVTGVGEGVEPVRLPPMWLVLVPREVGIATADAYRRLDELRAHGRVPDRPVLDPQPLRAATASLAAVSAAAENDLEGAALSLAPELEAGLEQLTRHGAMGARVTGSGPTLFGMFADRSGAERAASEIAGAIVTGLQ